MVIVGVGGDLEWVEDLRDQFGQDDDKQLFFIFLLFKIVILNSDGFDFGIIYFQVTLGSSIKSDFVF